MVVGGGVLGKAAGIVRGAMTPAGAIIVGVHLFIAAYPPVGGMTTERVAGEGVNGINKESPTIKFSGTGEHGNEIGIGRNKIIGVSRVRGVPESDHNSNNNRETMKEEEGRET
ncbi:MAG: hypothetical protein CVU62_14010 [Deltaproteobacteria bacterium HGW-Deltaproteobacteria-2]|jgi:hypothetical protein|nr:MAG: hypothetical protein CVU62_14010 [Deltaproteobacteria bacterium HGW-Deltaproteobacteria-2]